MKSLDERIADAERRATWQPDDGRRDAQRELDDLNAQKLAELIARTDPSTGHIVSAPVEAIDLASEPEAAGVPAGSFGGGVQPVPPGQLSPTSLDGQIAEAEGRRDWQTLNQLNAQKLAQVAERQRSRA